MKALEKAAKDREDADAGREAAVPAGAAPASAAAASAPRGGAANSGLTLEPLAPQQPNAPAAKPREPVPSPSPGKPAGAARATPAAASRESMLAATVIRASERDTGGGLGSAVAYVRERPLIALGPIAALFLIGYGTYIYLQMTSPGMIVKQPPPPVQSAPGAPIPTAPALVATSGSTAAAPQPPIPLTSLLPQLQEGAPGGKPATKPAAAAAKPAAAAAVPAPAPAPAQTAAPTAVRDTIKITSGGPTPTVNPLLTEAYAAFNSGNLEAAPRLYNQVLRSEPNNVDALLALAAIATQRGDREQASRHYLRTLEVEPRNALAQAGLIGMLGRADPLAAESRLKQLIVRDPSAYLHFTLGNLYADQNRWPDAQQAYFQAHHLQSDNPEYAYNLAVGLEHVGQPKLALEYYRRALQLAAAKSRANFSTATVEERISTLEKTVR
mgnify:CR=1 FL=1